MKIAVNGSHLFFDVEGASHAAASTLVERPTLIVVHGSPGSSDHTVFKPMFATLTDVAQIVYLDLAGCGRSEASSSGRHSLERWADDLAEFCDRLGIVKPIVLGNSAGGMVAAKYGIRHPDHPGKLVLSSTQARLDVSRCLAMFEKLGGEVAREAARGALVNATDMSAHQEFARVCMPLYNPTPQTRPRLSTFRPDTFIEFHGAGGTWHTMDFLRDLSAIRCPTLVLAGALDPITPLDDARDMVQVLDPSITRCEIFENAGHGVWLDDAPRTFALLRDFVTSSA